jgi:hypothetical protein
LRDHASELRALGASVAAVGVGGAFYARGFRDDAKIDFPLLVDEELAAYRAAGLGKGKIWEALSPANTVARLKAFAAGHRYGKPGQDPLQLGGSFVLAPGDEDLFVHRARTFGDNAPVEKLVEAVRSWRAPG